MLQDDGICYEPMPRRRLYAEHLVMIYPAWNGAMPALLKGFLAQTFRPAFFLISGPANVWDSFHHTLKERP